MQTCFMDRVQDRTSQAHKQGTAWWGPQGCTLAIYSGPGQGQGLQARQAPNNRHASASDGRPLQTQPLQLLQALQIRQALVADLHSDSQVSPPSSRRVESGQAVL